jgi:response regulator of citrate/malate metabolism
MKFKEILLIDDNDIDNFINKRVVAIEKVAEIITIKNSPIDALHYLRTKEEKFPELIFLDIKMPVMDGFGFLEEFSKFAIDKIENCAIVMLSSSYNSVDIKASERHTYVIKFLIKPLNNTKLREVMKLLS